MARIFNTYGPRMRADDGRAIPTFIGQALRGEPLTVFGDGSQTRSFCYISDMVTALYLLLKSPENGPVNLGNPSELSILGLAELVLRLVDRPLEVQRKPLPVDDPKVRKPDIARARELLGWEPRVSLEDGLGRTIEWFRTKMGPA
jgi:dTDP-glucose 4,6-dehydratase